MTRCLFVSLALLLITKATSAQDMALSGVLIEGEGWQKVAEGFKFTEGPAADAQGNVFFTDIPNNRIHKIALDGKVTVFAENTASTNGLMFGPDGRLYGCRNGEKKIVAYKADGTFDTIAEGVTSNDLVVAGNGGIYFTDPPNKQVWHVSPQREKWVVASGFRPNGVILWPDGGTLVITDSDAPQLWTFRVEPDGSLNYKERYYQPLQTPPAILPVETPVPIAGVPATPPGSDGMTIDSLGRLYVTTRMGLQMFDPTGRLGGTIMKPQPGSLSNACFGGPKLDTLYVTAGDKVFKRKTQATGVRYLKK